MDDLLLTASANAFAAGKLTEEQHQMATAFVGSLTAEQKHAVLKVAAFDWSGLIKILPALLAFIPGIGPFVGIIGQILPFIISLLQGQNGGGEPPTPIL